VSDRSPLAGLVCRVVGHDWDHVRADEEHSSTGLNLHEAPTGSVHHVCARCGAVRAREPRDRRYEP
jgi:hypothetical protein